MKEYIQASTKDIEVILNIVQASIKSVYPKYYPKEVVDFFSDLHCKENIINDINDELVGILLVDGVCVGTGCYRENHITRVYVLPEQQGKGYGSYIMNCLESIISKNYSKAVLDASLPASHLYEKRGYQTVEHCKYSVKNEVVLVYEVMEKELITNKTRIDYNGKKFVPLVNTDNGEVDSNTVFHYHQNGSDFSADYSGGEIKKGYMIGKVSDNGELDFYYEHINVDDEIRAGRCHSVPRFNNDGKIEMHEEWQWLPSLPLCSLNSFKFFLILQGFPCFFYALMIKYICRSIGLFHLLEEIMYIECFTNNAKPYLRLVQSVRVTNKAGKKLPQKQVILNLGPLDRFDDGQPDYVERLKKSFKAGTPLIPALLPYCDEKKASETYHFTINEGSPDCFGHPKLFSNILLECILEALGLNTFFSSYKGFTKLQYDVYGFAKLLIFGRLLNPASKYATVRQNEDYYEPILDDFNPDNVYDTLDFIAINKDKIIRRINTNLVRKAHRSPEIIYYDVTNFYFEIGEPDNDILDDEGNIVEKGLRKMGVCKEERKLPIVQMGLFMDDEGIPIAIETFPGNTLDHLTLRPALKKSIDDLDFSRFIMIADRGICNYQNLLHVLDAGNGYIVSKSLLKSTKTEQDWTYSDEGYTSVSDDFKYKSRIVKKNVKDENGNKRTIEEQVVVYWSRKFQDRAEQENKKFLDFLQKLQEHPENFRITAVQSKSLRKFFKKECVNEKTGEILDSSKIKAFVDFDKVAEYRKSLGYYQIVTSELTMDAQEVIDKYHGLTQIEDQFRVMKGDLDTRPLYVRTPEHVTAHLLICMISLIMLRIIQKRIKDSGCVITTPDAYWSSGLSAARIQAALNKWKVDFLPGDLYRFMDIDNPDLKLILDAFGISIPAKLYRRAELKSVKTGIKVFV